MLGRCYITKIPVRGLKLKPKGPSVLIIFGYITKIPVRGLKLNRIIKNADKLRRVTLPKSP